MKEKKEDKGFKAIKNIFKKDNSSSKEAKKKLMMESNNQIGQMSQMMQNYEDMEQVMMSEGKKLKK